MTQVIEIIPLQDAGVADDEAIAVDCPVTGISIIGIIGLDDVYAVLKVFYIVTHLVLTSDIAVKDFSHNQVAVLE